MMIDRRAALFEPLAVRGITLSNRIVMSPMSRLHSPDGVPGENVAAYYRRRAAGGTGLIVTEGVGIDHPSSIDEPNIPVMFGDAALAGWRRVVDAVHAEGGLIFPQLWHMGPMRKMGVGRHPHAPAMRPSGIWGPDGGHVVWGLDPRQLELAHAPAPAMTQADIDAVIAAYADAARNARSVGFDGIAIHGAHGYMPDAFLWNGTNVRDDRYGGDAVARTRFVVEMIQAIRSAIGPDMPIMLRFSQWKQQDYTARLAETPDALAEILQPISDAGVDIFDASTRRFRIPEFEGSSLNLAGWAQRITGKPAMTVGSIGLERELFEGMEHGGGTAAAGFEELLQRFGDREFALVGIGRLHLSNPDFAQRFRTGAPILDYAPHHAIDLH